VQGAKIVGDSELKRADEWFLGKERHEMIATMEKGG
jgi:hypothetical protein